MPTPRQPYWSDCSFAVASRRFGRKTGYIQPGPSYRAGRNAPLFDEHFRERIVPKSEWRSLYDELQPNQERLSSYTWDQNGFGTCTSNATACAMHIQWTRQFGEEWAITPAPPSIYPFCASGGNSGSSTNCNIERASEKGVLLIDTEKNRKVLRTLGLDETHVIDAVQWNAGKRCPQSWYEETAKHFKVEEFYEITSVDGWFSAVLLGFTILYGRSGHAICGTGFEPKGSDWTGIYQNSWGSWGRTINGRQAYGEDTYSYLQRTGAYRGAFAVRQISEPPGTVNFLSQGPSL